VRRQHVPNGIELIQKMNCFIAKTKNGQAWRLACNTLVVAESRTAARPCRTNAKDGIDFGLV
jgi:hypothetical protein